MSWIKLSHTMQELRESNEGNTSNLIRKGSISNGDALPQRCNLLNDIDLQPALDRDISGLTFFDGQYHFIYEMQLNGDIRIIVSQESGSFGGDKQSPTDPNIWIQVDAYGKALYSTVLADLGQNSGLSIR